MNQQSNGGETLRHTPLHQVHLAAGARMVPFAGWSMPVQYAGVLAEHTAVRERAGLFDVSHMGELSVSGPQALDLLQKITCNDVSRLSAGRAHYNALTTPQGTFVDDLLIYQLGRDDYLVVLNAANTAKDIAWVREHSAGLDVRLANVSDDWALLSLQGPASLAVLGNLLPDVLENVGYYRFVRAAVRGADCIVSRTGYTGEDGFEIYTPPSAAAEIWRTLMAAGESQGLIPAGLGARDTLRLEAKMALYGNDIDEATTVLEADLGWIVKLGKGPFVGREVLERQEREGITRKLSGFEMCGRVPARPGYIARHDGRELGQVTSGTPSPTLKKNIGLVYLPVDLCAEGTRFEIEIRGRLEPALVVPTPFYKRPRPRVTR